MCNLLTLPVVKHCQFCFNDEEKLSNTKSKIGNY